MGAAARVDDILRATAALEQANIADLGLNKVYDRPPDSLERFPCSIRYGIAGTLRASLGLGQDNIYRFRIEVFTERARAGGLQFADSILMPFVEAYQELYAANLSILGTCDVSGFDTEGDSFFFLEVEFNEVKLLRLRFEMWAKYMLAPITVSL